MHMHMHTYMHTHQVSIIVIGVVRVTSARQPSQYQTLAQSTPRSTLAYPTLPTLPNTTLPYHLQLSLTLKKKLVCETLTLVAGNDGLDVVCERQVLARGGGGKLKPVGDAGDGEK